MFMDKFYVTGGEMDDCVVYDPQTTNWTQLHYMKEARFYVRFTRHQILLNSSVMTMITSAIETSNPPSHTRVVVMVTHVSIVSKQIEDYKKEKSRNFSEVCHARNDLFLVSR